MHPEKKLLLSVRLLQLLVNILSLSVPIPSLGVAEDRVLQEKDRQQ